MSSGNHSALADFAALASATLHPPTSDFRPPTMLELVHLFRHAFVAGIALATVCSLLSVVVVTKRMAFIGEGIAHAGFGGLGTALFLGLTGGGFTAGGTWKTDLVVLAFCLATALAIGMLTRRRHVEPDSAIGIMLVAAMAWGVLMIDLHRNLQGH